MSKNILHLFKNKELEEHCLSRLTAHEVESFSEERYENGDVVITDVGLHSGKIVGYVPVLLVIGETEKYPDSFYSRELDADLTADEINDEVTHSINQAAAGRDAGLAGIKVLDKHTLNELASLGGEDIVVNGLRNFINNTTLQLNECRSLLEREHFDEIRYAMHALKSNSATLGAAQLAAMFSAMEHSLESGNYTNFEDKLMLTYTLLSAFGYLSNGWYHEA